MFIALTYMTVTDEEFQVVEAAIIVIFTFCSVAISSPEDLRFKRPEHIDYMTIGHFCHNSLVPLGKLLVDFGLNCYTVWFWWMGIDILGRAPCTGYAFFFHRVSFYGWLRVLGRIGSILLVLVELWLVYRAIRNHIPKERATQGIFEWMTSPQHRHQNPRVNDVADFTGAVIGCCIIGFYIASVEMMILWNHVTGVDTVMGNMGQMIPFLIGIGSMIAVILEWGSIKEKTVATQTVLEEEIHVENAADSGTPPVLQWEVAPVDLERQAISETANDPQSSAGVGSEKQPVTASGRTPEGRLPYHKRIWRWINEPLGPQIHVISNDPTRVWRWYTV
ncbi:hypothetical protein BDD12DRAFT_496123 [Trichophaea hybrida]|nr:hypothetical protein BDD12DRAFT_496123 [Trichophaea hybrida]